MILKWTCIKDFVYKHRLLYEESMGMYSIQKIKKCYILRKSSNVLFYFHSKSLRDVKEIAERMAMRELPSYDIVALVEECCDG